MTFKATKILEFNEYQKSGKTPFNIYGRLESFIEKIDGCKSNPEKSSITKVSERIYLVFQCLQYRILKKKIKHDL